MKADTRGTNSTQWKACVWNFFSHLIEYNCVIPILYLLLLLVETLQMLYFPFAYAECDTELAFRFSKVFELFIYVPLIIPNYLTFYIFWGLQYFFLLFVLSLIYFLLLYYKDVKGKHTFICQLLYKICGLLIVIYKKALFIPSIYAFLATVSCVATDPCWEGSGLVLSISSIIGLLFVLNFVIATEFFIDGYIKSTIPWAGLNTTFALKQQLVKVLMGIYLIIGVNDDTGMFFHPALTAIFLISGYTNYCGYQFYFKSINAFEFVRTFFFIFIYFGIYIKHNLNKNIILEPNIIIIVASLFASILLYRYQQIQLNFKAENDLLLLNNEVEIGNSIIFLGNLNKNEGKKDELSLIFTGMLSIHRNICKDSDCNCESLDNSLKHLMQEQDGLAISGSMGSSKNNLADNSLGSDSLVIGTNILKLWKKFILIMINNITERYPKSVSIKILASYYQKIIGKNYYRAYFNLVKASENNPSYYQEFQIYHMERIIDKALVTDNSKKKKLEIDVLLLLYFEETRKVFDTAMKECTQKITEFWGLLLLTNLMIEKMYTIGGEVLRRVEKVRFTFNYMVKIFPDHIRSYVIFTYFLRYVVNSEAEANEYKEKAIQIKRNVEFMQRESFLDESTFSINRETAIMVISGNLSNLGVILAMNEYTRDVFGYSPSEVMGLPVNTLMPQIIADKHYTYLLNFTKTGESKTLNNENFSFGLCKNGLLVPIAFITSTMPGLTNGLRYISFIRRDLIHIKKAFLNFPYKYGKGLDIGFILTSATGKILGITEVAANAFGIPIDYFEKKRKLFNEALKIQRLKPVLPKEEEENELLKGSILTLTLKPFYDMLDVDFLTEHELKSIKNKQSDLKVYAKLIKFEHQLELKYNVYVFTPLRTEPKQKNVVKEEYNKEDENAIKGIEDTNSITSKTTITEDKTTNLIKIIKKSLHERHRSGNITILRNIIVIGFFIYIVLNVIDFSTYVKALIGLKNVLKLTRCAYYRRSLLATMLEGFQSYINLPLGLEPNETYWVSNREKSLREWEVKTTEDIKNNEYLFQSYLAEMPINGVYEIISVPGITIKEIYIDGKVGSNVEGLAGVIIQMSSLILRLVNEESISSFNTEFIKTIYEPNPVVNNPLSQLEKDTYFVLINGLYHTMNTSCRVKDLIEEERDEKVKKAFMNSNILNISRAGIIVVLLIISFPFIKKVQTSKREILKLFGEMPRSKITEMIKNCEKFNTYQKQLKDPNERDYQNTTIDRARTNYLLAKKKARNNTIIGQHNIKESDEKMEDYGEDRFRDERRKKFDKYKAKVGALTLLFICLVLVIFSFQVMIFTSLLFWEKNMKSNREFMTSIQSKWFYITAALNFLMTTTKTNNVKVGGVSIFIALMQEALDAEDKANTAMTHHPSNQKSVAQLLYNTAQTNFCSEAYSTSSLEKINKDWCAGVSNGILNYGIKSTIYYLISDFKIAYHNITSGIDPDYSLLVDDKDVFERVLVPLYKFLIERASESELMYIDRMLIKTIWLFIIMNVLIFIGAAILNIFFVGKLNEELWKAKGIILLLPSDIVTENQAVKKMLAKQLHVII